MKVSGERCTSSCISFFLVLGGILFMHLIHVDIINFSEEAAAADAEAGSSSSSSEEEEEGRPNVKCKIRNGTISFNFWIDWMNCGCGPVSYTHLTLPTKA